MGRSRAPVCLLGMVLLFASTAVPAAPSPAGANKEASERSRGLKKGQKLARNKAFAQAEKVYRELLGKHPDDPQVCYELALVLVQSKKLPQAAAVLGPLGTSTHAEAAVYRVEARLSEVLAPLRGDPVFRKAVGIDPPPDFRPTVYERLVGTGGKWEQPEKSCESPLVKLEFFRAPKQKFSIVIESECQGDKDLTRFAGTWAAKDANAVDLTFPNPGGETERLPCMIEEFEGEDRVRCGAGTDLEFVVLSVRR